MGDAYQIRDQEMPYFLTFQVVGWADVFSLCWIKKDLWRWIIGDLVVYSNCKMVGVFANYSQSPRPVNLGSEGAWDELKFPSYPNLPTAGKSGIGKSDSRVLF